MTKYLFLISFLAISVGLNASDKRSDLSKNLQNPPLFRDGKGYYSYKKPLEIAIPKGKVVIQYFYHYGCEICLNADDYLKQYTQRHSDKVILQRSPAFESNSVFTAQMNATFIAIGQPELSDKYLFDSATRSEAQSLVDNNEAIKQWLVQNKIDIAQFHQTFSSEKVKQHIEQDRLLFQHYSPPVTPIAVLNGKYILIQNTLYNDDYTYAVLDFLVEKLQQEQQEENK